MTPRKSNSLLRKLGFWSVILSLPLLLGTHLYRTRCKIEWAHEGSTKGNCGAIKSAISIYYGDTEGVYPDYLIVSQLYTFSRYLEAMPPVKATHSGIGNGISESPSGTQVVHTSNENILVTGTGWLYSNISGHVYVNSSARDSKNSPYSTYGY